MKWEGINDWGNVIWFLGILIPNSLQWVVSEAHGCIPLAPAAKPLKARLFLSCFHILLSTREIFVWLCLTLNVGKSRLSYFCLCRSPMQHLYFYSWIMLGLESTPRLITCPGIQIPQFIWGLWWTPQPALQLGLGGPRACSTTELSYLTSDTPFHPPTPLGWENLLQQITVSHTPFALCLDLSFSISKAKNLTLLVSQHFVEATGDAQDLDEGEVAIGKKERLGREHSAHFSHYIM